MASLQQIFTWFKDGLYPNEDQFQKSWSSFWHKTERLPLTQVLGLPNELESKAEKVALNLTNSKVSDLDKNKADRLDLENVIAGFNPMGDALNIADLNTKPKRNNDSYFVLDQLNENSDPYIFRYDTDLSDWVNTKQVVYKNVATKSDLIVKVDKEQLPQEIKQLDVVVKNGFYSYGTGDFRADNGWRCAELDLSIVGRALFVTGMMNNTGAALAIYMKGDTYLSAEFRGVTGENKKYEKQALTIPNEATKVLLTANNSAQSTTPVLGVYVFDIAKDILTEQIADTKYTNKEDL